MKTEVPLTTGLKASSKMKHFQEPATQFQTPPSFFRGPKALSIPSILRYQQQTVFPFPQQNPSVLQGVPGEFVRIWHHMLCSLLH